MAITYNPYNWKIRKPIEEEIKERDQLIQVLYAIDTERTANHYLSNLIFDLAFVQKKIDDYYDDR